MRDYEGIDKKLEIFKKHLKADLTGNLEHINQDVKEKSKKVTSAMLKMLEIEPLMQDIKLILQKYDNTDRLHEDQIQDLLRQVEQLRGTKLERAPFEDFRKHVDQAFSDLAANY